MIARVPVLVIALLSVACVHKYAVHGGSQQQRQLPAAATVYVPTPPDGRDDRQRTYEGSGDWTASAIVDALRDRGAKVILGDLAVNPADAIAAAGVADADFVAYSRITHWSDRATEWSGIPDRITLQVSVHDVATDTMLDRQEIRASSRWATFGGDHPQELLPELTRRWAETVIE